MLSPLVANNICPPCLGHHFEQRSWQSLGLSVQQRSQSLLLEMLHVLALAQNNQLKPLVLHSLVVTLYSTLLPKGTFFWVWTKTCLSFHFSRLGFRNIANSELAIHSSDQWKKTYRKARSVVVACQREPNRIETAFLKYSSCEFWLLMRAYKCGT